MIDKVKGVMKDNRAFTLIELLVVIAILGVLVLLAAPRFLGHTDKANDIAAQQDAKVLENASALYHIDNDEWPVSGKYEDNVYYVDESKLDDEIQSLKNDYSEYVLVTDGEQEGKVYWVNAETEVDNDGIEIPGKNEAYDSENDVKFYGEVSAEELISGNALAAKIGLTAGTSQFSEENQKDAWLKFEHDGAIKYVAKRPFRSHINWDNINAANAVFGNKTIKIAGNTYKVRLMRGAEHSPSKNNDTDRDAKGSEWNQLMLPIHEQADTKGWSYPAYVEEDIKPINHSLGTALNGMYNDKDLYTHYTAGNGTYSWMQETTSNSSFQVFRGFLGVSSSYWHNSSYVNSDRGWRPILELVE